MHIDAHIRGKAWWKGLIVSALLLAASAFFLVLSITYGEVVGMVVSGLCTALFGFIVVASLMPGQHVSMQMVKGEMTPKQLEAAIAAEDFDRPIRFLQKAGRPGLFLASENWIVVEDHGNSVYVPKSKVRKIEMLMEPVEFGPELSGDGNTYVHYYNYFVFTCDEKHAYATGLISYDEAPEAERIVQAHFPHIPIVEVHTPREWKQ